MTIDVAGALKTLGLLREHGFTIEWVDAERLVRFEAPTTPPDGVIAMLNVHQQAIAALMKPDSAGFCGLGYHKVCRERFEELLACGAERDNARAWAFEGTLNLWLDREFEQTAHTSSSRSCAHCGRPEGDTVLLPIGWGNSHHWLHDACYETWRAARRAKAVKALAQYEIAENRPLDRWFIPST